MKPHVLLDVDGVLADFATAALEHVHAVTGDRYDPSIIRTWEVFDSLPAQAVEAMPEVYQRMKAPGGCMTIPVYPDAQRGFGELKKIANVTIVTSPFSGSPTWVHEREKWLFGHFGVHCSDIIHSNRKHRVHGDIFVDDKPSHIEDWHKYWVEEKRDPSCLGILWSTPRTTESGWVPFVETWDQLLKLVSEFKRG